MTLVFQTVTTPLDGTVFDAYGLIWIPEYSRFLAGSTRFPAGDTIMASDDGITWVTKTSPWRDVYTFAYSASLDRVVAGGFDTGHSATIMTSDDGGDTWTSRTGPFTGGVGKVAEVVWSADLSLFLAVGVSGTSGKAVAWSSDGITWHEVSTIYNGWHTFKVQWIDRLQEFWVWGDDGTFPGNPRITSPDGVVWTAVPTTGDLEGNGEITGVAWNPREQVYVGATMNGETVSDPTGTGVAVSADGIDWTALPNAWGNEAGPAYADGGTARNPTTGTQVVGGYSGSNEIIAIVNYGDLDLPWQILLRNTPADDTTLEQVYAIAYAREIRTWVVTGPTHSTRVIAYAVEDAEAQYQRIYGWRCNVSDDALETLDPVLTSPQGFTG